jgi:hypothetical protein
MKAVLVLAIVASGCVRNNRAPILVRDAYIAKGALVLEKCEVTATEKELHVGRCFLERRALPRVVDRVPSTPLPPPPPPPAVVPPPAAPFSPPADEEREIAEPTLQATPADAGDAPTARPPTRTGFGRVRDELASCATIHRVNGVVRVSLDIRANAVASARAGSPNFAFERCVATNLVGIELPDTQPNRLLTVPFAVGGR